MPTSEKPSAINQSNAALMETGPTPGTQRIVSLDVIRGFALLGILMMNIQSFGLIGAKYLNPNALGPIEGSAYWAWWFAYVFFDTKFMTLFSLLFGAGIVLMWERATQTGRKVTSLHYRRMFWLMLFGLAHAHLLWFGDILFIYSISGMFVYWLCGLRPRWLIPAGLLMVFVASAISLTIGWSMQFWDEAQLEEMSHSWVPREADLKPELAAYRGGWLDQAPLRSVSALFMETFMLAIWGFWRAGGLMLLGMALYKLDIFSAKRSNRFYLTAGIVSLTIGLAIVLFGIHRFEANDWSFEYSFFIGNQFNYWGSILMSFGYVCGLVWLFKIDVLTWLMKSLQAVGKMALTNYLLHSIICTTLFYGHGFGLFAKLGRVELIGIVVCIWLAQLILSPIWLSRFRFGPFEWLWRSLTYWKLQPFRR